MIIAIFLVAVLVVILLNVLVFYNFAKYRYVNDKVPQILFLFCVLFVLTIGFSITLITYQDTSSNSQVVEQFN